MPLIKKYHRLHACPRPPWRAPRPKSAASNTGDHAANRTLCARNPLARHIERDVRALAFPEHALQVAGQLSPRGRGVLRRPRGWEEDGELAPDLEAVVVEAPREPQAEEDFEAPAHVVRPSVGPPARSAALDPRRQAIPAHEAQGVVGVGGHRSGAERHIGRRRAHVAAIVPGGHPTRVQLDRPIIIITDDGETGRFDELADAVWSLTSE